MKIIMLGAPGAGKGTMSAKIVEKFNVNHISTGDIFRSEIGKGTALGMEAKSFMDKGLLVPDEVVNNMVKSYLEKLEDKKNGFLLDGYPRTLDQAKAFDALAEGSELAIDKVIALEIDFEKLADRVTGRRICKAQAHCGGGLTLAGRCGVDGRHQHQLPVRPVLHLIPQLICQFGFILTIQFQVVLGNPVRRRNLLNRLHHCFLSNLDI